MRALLIDDERLARQELRRLLLQYPDIDVVGEACNADEGLARAAELRPDLMFLDIEMPGKNAFAMLEEMTATPPVVFTTAYDAFAVKAFELNALDYLLKPIDPERMRCAVERVRALMQKQERETPLLAHERIFVRERERCWFVRLEQIFLIESEGNYCRLYFERQRPLILRSLSYLEERLDPQVFFRAGRKHIINLQHIRAIRQVLSERLTLEMPQDIDIPMSRRQSQLFREKLSL